MSLASLRWSLSLVKQTPEPALPRAFVLRAPTPARRASFGFNFGTMRLATVVATLLLFAMVATDFVTNFGGASAPAALRAPAASQVAAPTLAAFLPKSAESQAADSAVPPLPPAAAPVLAPTQAAKPTQAPELTHPAAALPPTTLGIGGAPSEAPTAFADNAAKTVPSVTGVARAPATSSSPTRSPSPSPTGTIAPSTTPLPTRTLIAQLQPTRAPEPPAQAPQVFVTPLRAAETGVFFFAIFFGVLMILLWRRK